MKTVLFIILISGLIDGTCSAHELDPSSPVSIRYSYLVDFTYDGEDDSVFVTISGDSMYDTFIVRYTVLSGLDTLFAEQYYDTLFENMWERVLSVDKQQYLKAKAKYYFEEMAVHCYNYGLNPTNHIHESQSEKYLSHGTPWEKNNEITIWFENHREDPNLPVLMVRVNPHMYFKYIYIPTRKCFVRID